MKWDLELPSRRPVITSVSIRFIGAALPFEKGVTLAVTIGYGPGRAVEVRREELPNRWRAALLATVPRWPADLISVSPPLGCRNYAEGAVRSMSQRARLFITSTASVGVLVFAYFVVRWQSTDLTRFFCYLVIATLASGLKIQLPGIDGTMSVNFLFILLGVLEMSLPETLIIGCTAQPAQCVWWARTKPDPAKVVFNVFSMMANAIALSYFTFHRLERVMGGSTPVLLVITALVFFLANTLPVTIIISLTEGKSPRKVWSECYFWSFPYYLVGAAIVFFVDFINKHAGWQTTLIILPYLLGLSVLSTSWAGSKRRRSAWKPKNGTLKMLPNSICGQSKRLHLRSRPKITRRISICNVSASMRSKSPKNSVSRMRKSKLCARLPCYMILANSRSPNTSSTSPDA